MSIPNITSRSVTRWKRRKRMAADRDHSLSSEKRLQQLYPDEYPPMVEISPGVVACTEEDDERFNQFLYETKQIKPDENDRDAGHRTERDQGLAAT